jgi:hypothetical protein
MSQVFSVSAHQTCGGFAFQGFNKRMAAPGVQKKRTKHSIDAKRCKKIGDTEDIDFEREWSSCAPSKRIGALCDALQKRNHD